MMHASASIAPSDVRFAPRPALRPPGEDRGSEEGGKRGEE